MGLSGSSLKPRRDAEGKRARLLSMLSAPGRPRDRGGPGPPAAAPSPAPSAAARREEPADGKVKSSRKKPVVPRIVITRASQETLLDAQPQASEQRTIRERTGWGPYHMHRDPSTAAAFGHRDKE